MPENEKLLNHVRQCSPFAAHMLDADASLRDSLLDQIEQPWTEKEMQNFLADSSIVNDETLKTALRRLRKQVMLRLIARDLNGLAQLPEVMETCTLLAEVTVNFALNNLDCWQREIYGDPLDENGVIQTMIVVGMGKLGGRELNVSSDIDLIFAYPEDGETQGAKSISNHEFFTRLGKKLILAIDEKTVDGFVFRVDMRLRPYGDSGPLVGSFAALEEYYQQQGREWERYAWIKGRVIAGPEQALQDLLRPFVFRKYLDYGAIASMRALKLQIQQEVIRREMHDNIKLGPGGIREIEFIAQVFQLIRGGRERDLQIRPTLQVLALLEKKGQLATQVVDELSTAYVFLRRLEHRIQYLQDAQSQTLPADDENRTRLAAGMNFTDWDALEAALDGHRKKVEHHFSQVFAEKNQATHPLSSLWQDASVQHAHEQLELLGYRDIDQTQSSLSQLRESGRYQHLPQISRDRFDQLMPQLIQMASQQDNPDVALSRCLTVLEAICRRASYLALLAEYPNALQQICKLCAASPWLTSYLARHPVLLDELLDTRHLYAVPDIDSLAIELENSLIDCGDDVERKLDVLRHFQHAQTFRFAAQDLTGKLTLEKLSDNLSVLADMILAAVIRHAWLELRNRHCASPNFAVIGYGKLGGKELGYASDLDLVFLYADTAPQAGENYARFGQRINNWLNSLTAAGQLYETDLRLRPDGASGLLVSSVEAFAEYQQNKAWVWEHQALARARFCAGDTAVGEAFENIRQQILIKPRDGQKLREEIIAMRQKMHDGHPNNTALFDLKHDSGGIVDVEFMVQYLVLAHAYQHHQLGENIGNIALLQLAGKLGLINAELGQSNADAYRCYRQEQHAQRLQGMEKIRVKSKRYQEQRANVKSLWDEIFQTGQ